MNDKYYNTGKKDFMKKWMKVGLIDLWAYALLDFLGLILFLGPFINEEIYQLLVDSNDVLVPYLMGVIMFAVSHGMTHAWFEKIFKILVRNDYLTTDISRKNIYKDLKNGNDTVDTH